MEIIISITILLIASLVLITGIQERKKASAIKVEKGKELWEVQQLEAHYQRILGEINVLETEFQEKKKHFEERVSQEEKIQVLTQSNHKEAMKGAVVAYADTLDQAYAALENQYVLKTENLKASQDILEKDIEKLKATLHAAQEAQLRERELEEKEHFYKINVSPKALQDIQLLENIREQFSYPTVLSKVIWTSFIQKPTNELCSRVLGGKKLVCGIYKITNRLDKKTYIGQSKDISNRWKEHIKCGLGIDPPSTNKLYAAMMTDGVWNFTFEMLEECSKEELNEREAQWIKLYESSQFGYNSNKGIINGQERF